MYNIGKTINKKITYIVFSGVRFLYKKPASILRINYVE